MIFSRLQGPNRTAALAVSVVLTMGILAWVAPPFYGWITKVTGYGGAVAVSDTAPDEILEQTISVRFDASLLRDMPLKIKPVDRLVEIRIGESAVAYFEAYNPTDRIVASAVSFNVAPERAGGYFTKTQCFCFETQVLQPGERVLLPLTYYVDPEITRGRESKFVKSITLSYTFYETDLPEDYALNGAATSVGTN